MAGEKISEIYCWNTVMDKMNIYLASSKRGVRRIGLSLNKGVDCLEYFKDMFPGDKVFKDEEMNRPLLKAAMATLKNSPAVNDLSLDIKYTPFQLMVWKAITMIPFGQTRTYGEVAMIIGKSGGARAVGQAMNRNPLPLIFP